MPAITGNVMIVDDNPANLSLLEEMLSERGYEVRSFPRGRMALAAAEIEPPDAVLLDINMPEMDGYEVCRQLKANKAHSAIPVIFLSALSATEDKVKGFQAGGDDYIPKPFQLEEVQARVATHIQLRRARLAEQDLLERTLSGAVETLWELVQLTAPVLAMRSRAIRDIVAWIAGQMELEHRWQYELAANLCLIGCLTIPERVFQGAYAGQKLVADEERMFRSHPEAGARLLSKIPRLEAVGEMIRGQQNPWTIAGLAGISRQGAILLHLAQALDHKLCRGTSLRMACAEIRLSAQYEPELIHALENYRPGQAEFESRRLRTKDLKAGMILEQDIFSHGMLILKEGTVLTETWIERVANFVRISGAADEVKVRVPAAGSLGQALGRLA
jgi:CheY-like chemotaxis protein